jgi:hypothetical protein
MANESSRHRDGLFDFDTSDFEATAIRAFKRVDFALDAEQPQFELAVRASH